MRRSKEDEVYIHSNACSFLLVSLAFTPEWSWNIAQCYLVGWFDVEVIHVAATNHSAPVHHVNKVVNGIEVSLATHTHTHTHTNTHTHTHTHTGCSDWVCGIMGCTYYQNKAYSRWQQYTGNNGHSLVYSNLEVRAPLEHSSALVSAQIARDCSSREKVTVIMIYHCIHDCRLTSVTQPN